MSARRKWGLLAGALALAVIGAVALLGFGSSILDGTALGGAFGRSGPEVLASSGGGLGDAGAAGGAALGGGFDGGPGFDPLPTGVWLPTATVSADEGSPFGTLAGVVVSSRDGRGVGGAELTFEREGTTTSVTSGPDGRFALVASEPGRYVLAVASAEGFLPFAPEWGHSPIAFSAAPRQRIDGVVVHLSPVLAQEAEVTESTGAPVPGATVQLIGAGEGERAMAPVASSFTTDDEGRARVEAWEGALLEASHPDHGRGRARLTGRAEPLRITLAAEAADEARGSIAGMVVDEAGAPIEGAAVRAFLPRRGLHPSAQTASDDEGRFVLSELGPGAHAVIAEHPAHPRAQAWRVETGRDDVVLRMPSGRAVSGRVIDEAGQPVPAFNVVAQRRMGPLLRHTVSSVSSYDADGRFSIEGLAEGEYELVATARGYPASEPAAVSVGAHGAGSVTLRLTRGGRIEGVVRDPEGAPIAGARIRIEGHLGAGSSAVPVLSSSVSGVDGSYALDGVSAEAASIRVLADGHHGRILAGLSVPAGGVLTVDVELARAEDGEEPRVELAGIGVVLYPRGEDMIIRRVVEGGGAQEAGLLVGDVILAVDGAPVTGLGFGGTLDRIRGPEGEPVRLTIRRGDASPTLVVITRRRVRT